MVATRGIGWRLSITTFLMALSISLFAGGERSYGLFADGVGAALEIPGAGAAVEVGPEPGVGVDVVVPGVGGSVEVGNPDQVEAVVIEPTRYYHGHYYRPYRYYYGRPYTGGYYYYGRGYHGPYQDPYYYPYYNYYEYHNYNWGW